MTKTEAESVIKGDKNYDDFITDDSRNSQPEEVVSESETGDNTGNPGEADSQAPENDNNAGNDGDDQGPEKPEEVKADKQQAKKKTFTPLEKQRHAFKLEKDKRRNVEARLKEREDEIAKLKEQLEKYQGLTLDDFKGDTAAFTEYKVDQRLGKEKVENWSNEVEMQRRQMQMQEAAEIADYRCQQCYPDEQERAQYQELIMKAESDFANMHPEIGYEKFSDFLLSEKDRSVMQYLQDSDMAPKLIRHFIYKPEAALRIMSMKNPYNKFIELKQLENRMIQHERIVANKAKVQAQPVQKVLPDTGKALKNNVIDGGTDWTKPWSKQDAINYINSHRN